MAVLEGEFFASRELSLARVTRETRQVVHAATRAPDPIVCVDTSTTSRAFGSELSVEKKTKYKSHEIVK